MAFWMPAFAGMARDRVSSGGRPKAGAALAMTLREVRDIVLYSASARLLESRASSREKVVLPAMSTFVISPRIPRSAFALCLVISILTSLAAAAQGLEPLEITTASGAHAFEVEIANNEASREKGLMFRRFMPADRGMLFEFEKNAPVAFWMNMDSNGGTKK